MSLFDPVIAMFQRGGLVIWPILVFSLYAVGLIVERWLHYREQGRLLEQHWSRLQAMGKTSQARHVRWSGSWLDRSHT